MIGTCISMHAKCIINPRRTCAARVTVLVVTLLFGLSWGPKACPKHTDVYI